MNKFLLHTLIIVIAFVTVKNTNAQPQSLNSNTNQSFLGAELFVKPVTSGKMEVVLKSYYSFAQVNSLDIEYAYIIDSSTAKLYKTIELKKVNEFIDVKYPMIENMQNTSPPGVKCFTYTGLIDTSFSKKNYKLVWYFDGDLNIINNVEFTEMGKIALTVQLNNSAITDHNIIPTLTRLPVVKVGNSASGTYLLDVKEEGETDIVEVKFSTPLFFRNPQNSKSSDNNNSSNKELFKKGSYRIGFSENMPLGKSLLFDLQKRELAINYLPFGNYIVALSIADMRNGATLSKHEAIFIIESVITNK